MDNERADLYRFGATVAFLVGLFQGVLPLALRLLFDVDRRFAVALLLPSPWWWLACLAIIAGCVAALAALDPDRRAGGAR